MYTIPDAPEWTNYYKFLMIVYDHNSIIPNRIPDFEGLMRIHLYCTLDENYDYEL